MTWPAVVRIKGRGPGEGLGCPPTTGRPTRPPGSHHRVLMDNHLLHWCRNRKVVSTARDAESGRPMGMENRHPGSGIGSDDVDAARAKAAWQRVLVDGSESLKLAQRLFRHLPSAPRCKMCHNPFGGVGGALVGMAGFKP